MGIVIHRSRHAQQYVVVPNAIARNARLSFRARGLLVMLLSLPPEWHVTTDQLAEDNPDSRTAVRAAMRELRESGYVEVHREQGGKGRWRTRLEVFDTPATERDPSRVRCDQGKQQSSQVAPNAGQPAAGQPAPKRSTGPKYGAEVQENRSRPASHDQDQDQNSGRVGTRSVTTPARRGRTSTHSAANSENHRVHDGPDNDGSDAQQIPIPVTHQSQAADRNAREAAP
jgi:hypothetical protein